LHLQAPYKVQTEYDQVINSTFNQSLAKYKHMWIEYEVIKPWKIQSMTTQHIK
jgi:hypothetical protein